ncbi:class V chitinase CHIT5a-like [Fagus crenata]
MFYSWDTSVTGEHALLYDKASNINTSYVGTGPGNNGIMIYTDIEDFNVANDAAVVFTAQTVSTYSHAGTNWIGYDGPQSTEK